MTRLAPQRQWGWQGSASPQIVCHQLTSGTPLESTLRLTGGVHPVASCRTHLIRVCAFQRSWLRMLLFAQRCAYRGVRYRLGGASRWNQIHDFTAKYNKNAAPFVWRKCEVRGAQLRNTIVNLRK